MITENGRTRLSPGDNEVFFRDKDGKIIFLVHPSCGVNQAVDCTDLHRQMEKHLNEGDGWPEGHPTHIPDASDIWKAFKNVPFPG